MVYPIWRKYKNLRIFVTNTILNANVICLFLNFGVTGWIQLPQAFQLFFKWCEYCLNCLMLDFVFYGNLKVKCQKWKSIQIVVKELSCLACHLLNFLRAHIKFQIAERVIPIFWIDVLQKLKTVLMIKEESRFKTMKLLRDLFAKFQLAFLRICSKVDFKDLVHSFCKLHFLGPVHMVLFELSYEILPRLMAD